MEIWVTSTSTRTFWITNSIKLHAAEMRLLTSIKKFKNVNDIKHTRIAWTKERIDSGCKNLHYNPFTLETHHTQDKTHTTGTQSYVRYFTPFTFLWYFGIAQWLKGMDGVSRIVIRFPAGVRISGCHDAQTGGRNVMKRNIQRGII